MVKSTDLIASLAGTYSLLNNTVTNLTTSAPLPSTWGTSPSGLLTYTRYGHMSAVMSATHPPWRPTDIRWPPKDSDPPTSWELVGRHSMSYAGPFALNASVANTEREGQLLHGPIVAASVPVMIGETQARNYAVVEEGDEVLLNVWLVSQGLRSEVWWKRIVKG
ncbi:Lipocalin-like domain-containing protein [Schizothecium vesticola]|uniref:Lipocalin-like domain-containing protein n=1 Tax=Schizothecium vesticola TaxID=314040 RepID=A0AA40K024_9PEZI|nr:Lipocalin-like domain-containing protein [Schizothecium vesticola]